MKPSTNHFNTQVGKLGRPFRLSQIVKGNDEKWINRVLCSDWYYVFKYLDGGFFAIHKDINGNTKQIITDLEIINKL